MPVTALYGTPTGGGGLSANRKSSTTSASAPAVSVNSPNAVSTALTVASPSVTSAPSSAAAR
jgi:hypothetical protein